MTKKTLWINGNKMLFESSHKTFNHKVDGISTGNVLGNIQVSGFIRPYNELECYGVKSAPGHLQEWDLKTGTFNLLPQSLKDWIREHGKDKTMIAYSFFYWQGMQRNIIGWIVTDGEHNFLKKVHYGWNYKKESALDECQKYVCNGDYTEETAAVCNRCVKRFKCLTGDHCIGFKERKGDINEQKIQKTGEMRT